jgi:hypothetical protein
MAAPRGVLAVGPAATTTDVEDVDGRPPVGAVEISGSGHHRSDVDGGPHEGAGGRSGSGHHRC